MTPAQYLDKVIGLYRRAKVPRFPHPRIHRGRAPAVASALEDLTALFLAMNLPRTYEFWVDQPVSFPSLTERVYFDVAQVRGSVIRHVIELKTDLGWERSEFVSRCRERRDRMRRFRGAIGRLDGEPIEMATRCGYHLVVLSGANFPRRALDVGLAKVRRLEPAVYVYILTRGVHPNAFVTHPGSKRPDICAHAFDVLLRRLAR
jgi:hypothetical protein